MIEHIIAKLSDPKHWSKGRGIRTVDEVDAFCIAHAIENIPKLHDVRPVEQGIYLLVAQAIRELYPERWSPYLGGTIGGVVRFNDHPETTHEDAMKVLKRARELEEIAAVTAS